MSLDPGIKLGRYEICLQLGAGGMGDVYLALDTELDRTVATKILPESSGTQMPLGAIKRHELTALIRNYDF